MTIFPWDFKRQRRGPFRVASPGSAANSRIDRCISQTKGSVMRSRLVWQDKQERTFVLMLEAGEEVISALDEFAAACDLAGAALSAHGAFERATLGIFDLREQEYRTIELVRPELVSLVGEVLRPEAGRARLHLHAVLDLGGRRRGGHLLRATVRSGLEPTVVEPPLVLHHRQRPDNRLALVDPPA